MTETGTLEEYAADCWRLSRENAELKAEVREWLCETCNTIYPGPPAKGVWCVICPKCEGMTGPRMLMENRKLRAEVERLDGLLKEIEEHPHCRIDERIDDRDGCHLATHKIAHAAGHRCCAEIARRRNKK